MYMYSSFRKQAKKTFAFGTIRCVAQPIKTLFSVVVVVVVFTGSVVATIRTRRPKTQQQKLDDLLSSPNTRRD